MFPRRPFSGVEAEPRLEGNVTATLAGLCHELLGTWRLDYSRACLKKARFFAAFESLRL